MNFKAFLASASLALLAALPGRAQQTSLLEHMVGHWVLQGIVHGLETTHDVDMDWVVNREYLRIHEVSRERNPAGGPVYEALVFIGRDVKPDEYVCLWLDSTGDTGLAQPILGHARRSGNTLPFLFKFKEGELFHTTFALGGDGTWAWLMDDEQDGKLSPFARLKLTRKPAPAP